MLLHILRGSIEDYGQTGSDSLDSLSSHHTKALLPIDFGFSLQDPSLIWSPEIIRTISMTTTLSRSGLQNNSKTSKRFSKDVHKYLNMIKPSLLELVTSEYNSSTSSSDIDEFFMREALVEAKKAAQAQEVPVGAVIVLNGKIIARAHNRVEELHDGTQHAEMICIQEASRHLQNWRLLGTTLYITLEPCSMRAGAVFRARVGRVVWGAINRRVGADGSWVRLFPDGGERGWSDMLAREEPSYRYLKVRRGVLSKECANVIQRHFRVEELRDATQHAEMICIRKASKCLPDWRLLKVWRGIPAPFFLPLYDQKKI